MQHFRQFEFFKGGNARFNPADHRPRQFTLEKCTDPKTATVTHHSKVRFARLLKFCLPCVIHHRMQ
ncbi:Uncharacterised protein [Vibrio cholerae]|nr:Uncharacterised protein [Vibrio cholerae]